jgi:hypothetical protein
LSENRQVGPGASPPVPPVPPPREADDRLVTGTITIGWAIALVVVAVLAAQGVIPVRDRWWVWTCATGVGMGLFGLWYVPVLKRRRERAAARRAQPSGESPSESRDSGSNTVSSTETPGSSTRS